MDVFRYIENSSHHGAGSVWGHPPFGESTRLAQGAIIVQGRIVPSTFKSSWTGLVTFFIKIIDRVLFVFFSSTNNICHTYHMRGWTLFLLNINLSFDIIIYSKSSFLFNVNMVLLQSNVRASIDIHRLKGKDYKPLIQALDSSNLPMLLYFNEFPSPMNDSPLIKDLPILQGFKCNHCQFLSM